jgi:hypothetical protein
VGDDLGEFYVFYRGQHDGLDFGGRGCH